MIYIWGYDAPMKIEMTRPYTSITDITIVDTAIGVPKHRTANIETRFKVLMSHNFSDHGGLWIISSKKMKMKKD